MSANDLLSDLIYGVRARVSGFLYRKYKTINFIGATAEENEATGELDITFEGGGGGGTPVVRSVASYAALEALTVAGAGLVNGVLYTIVADPTQGPWVWNAGTGSGTITDQKTTVKLTETGTGTNGRFYNTQGAPVLPTFAALRLATVGKHSVINVQARENASDGGAGLFDYDAGDTTSADDDATILVAGTKRYKRRYTGSVDPRWWGVVVDSVGSAAANVTALETMRDFLIAQGGGTVRMPVGTIWLSRTVVFDDIRNVHIQGESANLSEGDGSWLRLTSAATLGSAIIDLHNVKSCAIRYLGVYGLDNNNDYRAGRGFNLSVLDGAHVTFDVQLDHVVAYGIANQATLYGFHTTSNLAADEAAIPAVTLTGMTGHLADGFPGTGLCYPVVEITDIGGGTARGQALFQYSLDGGKTFNGVDLTTAATYAIPATSLVLHFPVGTYDTDYYWHGLGCGIYVGSRRDGGIDTQCDTVAIRNYSCTSTAIGIFYDSTQAIGMSVVDPTLIANVHGIVVHACSFLRVDGNEVSSISQGRSVITTRRAAGDVEYNGIYTEIFGGDGFSFPACARPARTTITNCQISMSHTTALLGRAPRNLDYRQGGYVIAAGSTFAGVGGNPGSVFFVGEALVPHVRDDCLYLGDVTRTITNCAYEGAPTGPNAGEFGDRFREYQNMGVRFSPVATSSTPTFPTDIPPCAIYCDDATPVKLVGTNVDKTVVFGLLADSLKGLVYAKTGIRLGATIEVLPCTGTPEGAVTAPVGSIALRTDGGAGTTAYIKESGSGNTGWTAITTEFGWQSTATLTADKTIGYAASTPDFTLSPGPFNQVVVTSDGAATHSVTLQNTGAVAGNRVEFLRYDTEDDAVLIKKADTTTLASMSAGGAVTPTTFVAIFNGTIWTTGSYIAGIS